jgi:hypothetical protein
MGQGSGVPDEGRSADSNGRPHRSIGAGGCAADPRLQRPAARVAASFSEVLGTFFLVPLPAGAGETGPRLAWHDQSHQGSALTVMAIILFMGKVAPQSGSVHRFHPAPGFSNGGECRATPRSNPFPEDLRSPVPRGPASRRRCGGYRPLRETRGQSSSPQGRERKSLPTCSFWSGCRDLNPGPLDPQSSALTKLRHSPLLLVPGHGLESWTPLTPPPVPLVNALSTFGSGGRPGRSG